LVGEVASGCWTLKPGIEQTLRELGIRGAIIKTMHRAMTGAGRDPDALGFALHGENPTVPVIGRVGLDLAVTIPTPDNQPDASW
jgi:hypothetical protein